MRRPRPARNPDGDTWHGPRQHPTPIKKDGFWYFIRLVPPEYASYDDRKRIASSTKIRIVDDPRGIAAQRKVDTMYEDLLAFWTAKKEGRHPAPHRRLDQVISTAQMFGVYPYLLAKELIAAGVDVMAQRLMMLQAPQHMDNAQANMANSIARFMRWRVPRNLGDWWGFTIR